ncbi:MAG: hypothetical protein ACRDB9_00960 [Cetobacterium sp.]
MAKETQKDKIDRLEKQVWQQKVLISELKIKIAKYEDSLDSEVLDSDDTVKPLKNINTELQEKINNIAKLFGYDPEEINKDNSLIEKEINELKDKLRVAEHFNKQSNVDMLAERASKRGRIIDEQNIEIEQLRNDVEKLKKEIHKLKNERNNIELGKNERGAGRKSLFSDDDKKKIKDYRKNGKTIKEISELYCCSVGLIHKIINE